MTPDAQRDLLAALRHISALSGEVEAELLTLASHRYVDRGEHLLRAGERARHVLFVRRGLLREYYVDAQGKETTRRFCAEGEFSGSLADLISPAPALASIECLAAGEIIEVEWRRVDGLSERHPSLMRLLRRFAEILYVRKMRREHEMLTLSAAQRYRLFVAQAPAIAAAVPKHLIASYLGITPVHLSRICADEKRKQPSA